MTCKATIVGVHAISADEPVHLIELVYDGPASEFDFGQVTQEIPDEPKKNWQAAYDERVLEDSIKKSRFAFFFHYLDLGLALETPCGSLVLPQPTGLPSHLPRNRVFGALETFLAPQLRSCFRTSCDGNRHQ